MNLVRFFSSIALFNNEAVLVEMTVAQILFSMKVPRKPHHRRRFVVVSLTSAVCTAVLTAIWYGAIGSTLDGVLRSFVNFLLLFILVTIATAFILDCDAHVVVSISICGYALQHIASACTNLARLAGEALQLPMMHSWICGEMMRIVIFVVVYAVAYICFVRHFDVMKMRMSSNISLMFLTLSTLAVTLGLSSYASTGTHSAATSFVFRSVSILVCVMVLLMFSELSRNQRLSDELAFVKRMNDMRINYYELLKDTIDTTNIHYHDLKHQVARLRASVNLTGSAQDANAMLDEISKSVNTYDSIAKTGNAALDVVLTQKSMECGRKNIRFTYMFDTGCLDGISDYDIYSLFGNALDNAIEASEKIADANRKVIKLTGTMRGALASINIVNYYEELHRNEQGDIITTKRDKDSHGYGLKSIRMTVDRLGGGMSVTAEHGMFDLNIMLPKNSTSPRSKSA